MEGGGGASAFERVGDGNDYWVAVVECGPTVCHTGQCMGGAGGGMGGGRTLCVVVGEGGCTLVGLLPNWFGRHSTG